MEVFTLETDIHVFCVRATSFPAGIADARQQLNALIPSHAGRKLFGISRPENGVIVYKAATEELTSGEAEKLNCEKFIIEKGQFICLTIKDYLKNTSDVEKAFQQLIAYPNHAPDGYCLEWYLSESDMRCMVPLKKS